MTTYLLIIGISVLFTYWAERSQKNRFLFLFFSFVALFIPAFFAGCRDLTVGFDVMFYEYDIYKSTHYSNSFLDLLSSDVGNIEPLFLLINYLAVLNVFSLIEFCIFHEYNSTKSRCRYLFLCIFINENFRIKDLCLFYCIISYFNSSDSLITYWSINDLFLSFKNE